MFLIVPGFQIAASTLAQRCECRLLPGLTRLAGHDLVFDKPPISRVAHGTQNVWPIHFAKAQLAPARHIGDLNNRNFVAAALEIGDEISVHLLHML